MDIETAPSAFAAAVDLDPARPLVTYYGGAGESGAERVELSVRTAANWADKIANLLRDQLWLEPGLLARVELPTHWQSFVVVLGIWRAGLVLATDPGEPAAASFVGPAAAAAPRPSIAGPRRESPVVACSLLPLGARFADPLPDGWLDFAAEVPPQPDVLIEPAADGPDALAVGGRSHRQLATEAAEVAAEVGLGPGGRLLTDLNPAGDGLLTALVAPLVRGGSVVLTPGLTPDQREPIAAQEQVTAQAWSLPVAGRGGTDS